MPFHTPGGLKIRLDLDTIERMIDASGIMIDINDASADVELWARLPAAMCAVAAMGAALWTHSVASTLMASLVAFGLGNGLQQFNYSALLRIIFPQSLGASLIAAPASVACTVYLYWSGYHGVAFTQLAMVFFTITGLTDILLLPLTPVRVFLRRIGVTPPLGDVELAFIAILNSQAARQHATLDWEVYDRQRDLNTNIPL